MREGGGGREGRTKRKEIRKEEKERDVSVMKGTRNRRKRTEKEMMWSVMVLREGRRRKGGRG